MAATLKSVSRHPMQDQHAWTSFPSPLGWIAVVFDEECLHRIVFGHRSAASAARAVAASHTAASRPTDDLPSWVTDLCDRLEQFGQGEPQTFSDIPIATEHLTPFAQRVVTACRKIEWGQVLSYGQLADRVGRAGAARAIGNVMATNRHPLVVPCHRVVGSAGSLGGFSAPGGLSTKQSLLELEGALPLGATRSASRR